MAPILEKIIELTLNALKEEDLYLREALNQNSAYSTDRNGLLKINNERYYQFVIARYLFKYLNRKIGLESNYIDIVVFDEVDDTKYDVIIEMKRWMSSTGISEIGGITTDFVKLEKEDARLRLMLIFSSNPKSVSINENLIYLSEKIGRNIDPSKWEYASFDTVGINGNENVFWVAGYEVQQIPKSAE